MSLLTIRVSRFFVLIFCSMAITTASAQVTTAPLVMFINGDLWAWNGTSSVLNMLTNNSFIRDVVVSPDGERIAYLAWSPLMTQATDYSAIISVDNPIPNDVWILETIAEESRLAGGQAPDATFGIPGEPANALVRVKPAWSPDGRQLAYVELALSDRQNGVVPLNRVGRYWDRHEYLTN
jgi:WD40-like Beta Propeller Repeat